MLVLLAACGGGGGGANAPDPDPDPVTPVVVPTGPQTGPQMRASFGELADAYTDPVVYTTLSAVPTTGSATYRGYLRGDLSNTTDAVTDSLIGRMTMQVGFTASSVSVSGSVTDFADAENRDVDGSLTLSNGSLDRGGNPANDATLNVTFAGTLTDAGSRTLNVGGQLEGDFLAGSHRAVGGDALGRVTVGGINQDFDGSFIAQR
jgi:hypothetical protein